MPITITIQAETGEDLRRQLLDLLVERHAVSTIAKVMGTDAPEIRPTVPTKAPKPLKDMAKERVAAREARKAAPEPQPEPRPIQGVVALEEEGPKPEADFVVDMDPAPEPDPLEEGFLSNEVQGSSVDDTPLTPTGTALANEKLKTDTIAIMQDMFAAGKVKVIRHVLDTYGKGAKSFPEIDAAEFPVIAAALQRGEAA